MNDNQLPEIIDELQAEASKGDPRVSIDCTGPCLFITANRAGYLKLATTFMEAALTPLNPPESPNYPQIRELTGIAYPIYSKLFLAGLHHQEEWPDESQEIAKRKKHAKKSDRIALFTCAIIVFLAIMVCILAFIGLQTIGK
jgi:hypothetical protein